MKNKAIAVALIGLMALSAVGMMPSNVKAVGSFQGYAIDSTDGVVQYYDGTNYYGVIYGHTAEDPTDWTTSQDNGGESAGSGYTTYKWDTTTGYDPFTSPAVGGDHIYLYGEALKNGMGAADGSQPYNHLGNGVANYTFCSNWTVPLGDESNSPTDTMDNLMRWEPINVSVTSGATWMNITVQAFRFTSYQYVSPANNSGTYENTVGFIAHIKNKDGSWLGNYTINNFTAGPNAPAPSYGAADPGQTGIWWINLTSPTVSSAGGTSIKLANSYIIQASALFTDGAGGTYETQGWSEPPVTVPEFSTMLIPIIATIGLFIAVTYIYRKKD